MEKNKKSVYIGADIMKKGNQLLREKEKEQIRELGFDVYSPKDDKEINDKSSQSEEDNNHLAEKIFKKDTKGMIQADIIVFEVDNTSVGTTAEIGQWAMVKKLASMLEDLYLSELAKKPIFFYSSDLRDTDLPEAGIRRSHSYNQYLVGCAYECNPNGIQAWQEVLEELDRLPREAKK